MLEFLAFIAATAISVVVGVVLFSFAVFCAVVFFGWVMVALRG